MARLLRGDVLIGNGVNVGLAVPNAQFAGYDFHLVGFPREVRKGQGLKIEDAAGQQRDHNDRQADHSLFHMESLLILRSHSAGSLAPPRRGAVTA